jgi:hypothetical protein
MNVRKLIAVLCALAAAVPAVAGAGGAPGGISTGGTVELRGVLSHYVAPSFVPGSAESFAPAGAGPVVLVAKPGSVTIAVVRSDSPLYAGSTQTIRLTAATQIVLGSHKTIRDGDIGTVKITLGDVPPLGAPLPAADRLVDHS